MKKDWTSVIFVLALASYIAVPAIGKKEPKKVDGAVTFAERCAKCHMGGGNLVNNSRPLAGSKQLASVATFKAYLNSPPGHMPYYQEIVSNKATLESLYNYCKQLKPKPMKAAFVAELNKLN